MGGLPSGQAAGATIAAQNNYFLERHSEICRKGLTKKFRKEKQSV
jgi:hypothetical protein